MNDINIINGTIVRPEGCEKADIGIRGGKIVSAVNKPGDLTEAAEKTIDASGLYVFPGMIDTHVHIRGGILSHRESFASGTQAAASGGITTIMEMPIAEPARLHAGSLRRTAQGNRRAGICRLLHVRRRRKR